MKTQLSIISSRVCLVLLAGFLVSFAPGPGGGLPFGGDCVVNAQEPVVADTAPSLIETSKRTSKELLEAEPNAIDPAQFLAKPLTQKIAVDFDRTPISDVAKWLTEQLEVPVRIDRRAFDDIGIDGSFPITESMPEVPFYCVLNRLHRYELAWMYEDEIVVITSPEELEIRLVTRHYAVGDLLTGDTSAKDLLKAVKTCVHPFTWDEVGGSGSAYVLGNVLIVSQTPDVQLELSGFLEALRKPGLQTFVGISPQDLELNKQLDIPVTAEFLNAPLSDVAEDLAKQAKLSINIDRIALGDAGLDESVPITLKLADKPLHVVLKHVLGPLYLTYIISEETISITTPEAAEVNTIVATYDVSDICVSDDAVEALTDSISTMVAPTTWADVGGSGSLCMAGSGTLVVSQTREAHVRVLEFLQGYRKANSDAKEPAKLQPNMVTRYYRMPTAMANDLELKLPQLVDSQWWQPVGPAKVSVVAVGTFEKERPKRLTSRDNNEESAGPEPEPAWEEQSVLIVHQSLQVQSQVADLIQELKQRDDDFAGGFGSGFGGGFLDRPVRRSNEDENPFGRGDNPFGGGRANDDPFGGGGDPFGGNDGQDPFAEPIENEPAGDPNDLNDPDDPFGPPF